jgi:hypothetical protein
VVNLTGVPIQRKAKWVPIPVKRGSVVSASYFPSWRLRGLGRTFSALDTLLCLWSWIW